MNRNPDQSMEGISRIDAEKAQGWYVRIYYPDAEIESKFFSDSVFGGKQKALQAAKQYRKEVFHKNPPLPKLPFRCKKKTATTPAVCWAYQRLMHATGMDQKRPCSR